MKKISNKTRERALLEEAEKPTSLRIVLKKLVEKLETTDVLLREALWRLLNAGKVEYTNDGKLRLRE